MFRKVLENQANKKVENLRRNDKMSQKYNFKAQALSRLAPLPFLFCSFSQGFSSSSSDGTAGRSDFARNSKERIG